MCGIAGSWHHLPKLTCPGLPIPAASSVAPITKTCQVSPVSPVLGDRTLANVPANLPDVESWPRTGCKKPCELAILRFRKEAVLAMSGYRHDETPSEDWLGSLGSGEYHGYPLRESQEVRGL